MSDQSQWFIYVCDRCENRVVADSAFEADKPNGFFLDLRKVSGEKYRYHEKTPETVFFCTKECLIDGLQYGISHMVEKTIPIGIDARKLSPWR
jgi:hypothetical protein